MYRRIQLLAFVVLVACKGPSTVETTRLPQSAIPSLPPILENLGVAPKPQDLDLLIGFAKDQNPSVRSAAFFKLRSLRDPKLVQIYISALRDTDAEIRRDAAYGLGDYKDTSSMSPLITALNDPDSSVREGVIHSLGKMKSTIDVVGPLIGAFEGAQGASNVRAQAAEVLARSHDPRAARALMAALAARDTVTICAAIGFFVAKGEPNSEAALIAALNKSCTISAAETLLNSGNPVLREAAQAWAKESNFQILLFPSSANPTTWGSGR
jgi:HEAT repeat protein